MAITYDPFQQEAIRLIDEGHSLLVCAPTGTGKTVIAETVIARAMNRGEEVIYTAPIKALSNQKYRDFREQWGERIGIVTGDVSINANAPILIMTTEIYRNSLFENPERLKRIRWIIFDEIHYLDDPERGTVWEEAILFSPTHVQLLGLSATVPNIRELARWIQTVHGHPIEIVEEKRRVVPLRFHFQCQGTIFSSTEELFREGYRGKNRWPPVWRLPGRQAGIPHGHVPSSLRIHPNREERLIEELGRRDRLPCLYFAFSRRRVEELAWQFSRHTFIQGEERKELEKLYEELLDRYGIGEERSAVELRELMGRGIAYHHAGMLPTLKEVVERLFTSRLIKLIFTTETFALGINMPARSVVFDRPTKRFEHGVRALRRREFQQMAGRAGRRGLDEAGYVYLRLQPYDLEHQEVVDLLEGESEPVTSQFNADYATILNLYRLSGDRWIEAYPKSFHAYQAPSHQRKLRQTLLRHKLQILQELNYVNRGTFTPKGEFASGLYGYELMLGELYGNGVLTRLDSISLNTLLAALVYEGRRGQPRPPLNRIAQSLRDRCEEVLRAIRYHEAKLHILPRTRPPHFNLSKEVEAWTKGTPFARLEKISQTDPGELVRVFRMVIQLLREIRFAHGTPQELKETALRAEAAINRDQVDAERQLRTP